MCIRPHFKKPEVRRPDNEMKNDRVMGRVRMCIPTELTGKLLCNLTQLVQELLLSRWRS